MIVIVVQAIVLVDQQEIFKAFRNAHDRPSQRELADGFIDQLQQQQHTQAVISSRPTDIIQPVVAAVAAPLTPVDKSTQSVNPD